jgi:hypothetical protein
VFANGGSGLIGKSGRKTANVWDKHAKETTTNTVTDFTGGCFHHLLRKTGCKVPQDVPKGGQETLSADAATDWFSGNLRPFAVQVCSRVTVRLLAAEPRSNFQTANCHDFDGTEALLISTHIDT